jgi:hypothetical protein
MKPLPLLIIVLLTVFYYCSCTKEYSFEKAAGTLKDSLDQCSPIHVSGTYHMERLLAPDSFYVTVTVNVTKPGAYTIKTDKQNGFQFSASGNFNSTGLQNVQLRPTGQAIRDTLTVFHCSFDSSECIFSIEVKDNSIPVPAMELNTWWFIDSTEQSYHHGRIDPISTWFSTTPVWNYLNIIGWPQKGGGITMDTLFLIALYLPHPVIETGTYTISSGISSDQFFGYANNNGVQWQYFYYYVSGPYQTPDFVFKLISYDSGQKILKGSFRGVSRHRAEYSDYVGRDHIIYGAFYIQLN